MQLVWLETQKESQEVSNLALENGNDSKFGQLVVILITFWFGNKPLKAVILEVWSIGHNFNLILVW